jgi:hypothetical protein
MLLVLLTQLIQVFVGSLYFLNVVPAADQCLETVVERAVALECPIYGSCKFWG